MTLQELLAKRASNVKAMRELNDKVLSENRAYTAEETQAQERMDAAVLTGMVRVKCISFKFTFVPGSKIFQ